MVTLYGDSRSGNCYKVAWLLSLLGQDFQWVETDVLRRETRTAAFMALNPHGKVPLLRLSTGDVLAESNAMLLFLSEGSRYLPKDRYQRALVYQWLFFEQYSHEPYVAVARFIVALSGRAEEESERLKGLYQRGHESLAIMDQHLSGRDFMVAEAFGVADIGLFAYTHVAHEGGFDLTPYPAISRWLERVEAEPGFLSMRQACQ